MTEKKVYSKKMCSWCLEAIDVSESVYELEGDIILHKSCYNSLNHYPGSISEGVKREVANC